MREEIYLNLLDRAMEEELGLAVETNNPQRLSFIAFPEINKLAAQLIYFTAQPISGYSIFNIEPMCIIAC